MSGLSRKHPIPEEHLHQHENLRIPSAIMKTVPIHELINPLANTFFLSLDLSLPSSLICWAPSSCSISFSFFLLSIRHVT